MAKKDVLSGERSGKDFLGPPSESLQTYVWDTLRAMKEQNRLLRYKSVEEVMSPLINQARLKNNKKTQNLLTFAALLNFLL